MPMYDIRISGYAANVEADSPEAAIKQIKEFSHVYCTFTVLDSKTYEPVPMASKVYRVVEQYPHREVASFDTLADAQDFILASRNLAMPIVVTNTKDDK